MPEEIKLGEIVNGSIQNPDGRWYIDNNDNLVLETSNNYDMSGVDLTTNSVTTDDLEFNWEAPQDVQSSRSLGSQETNDTDHPLLVKAIVRLSEDIGATNSSIQATVGIRGEVNGSLVELDEERETELFTDGTGTRVEWESTVTLIAGPGDTYTVDTNTNDLASVDIVRWQEAEGGTQ